MLSVLGRYVCNVLQVENRSEEVQMVQACLACHGSSPHVSTRDRHLEDPNVMLAGAFSGKLQLFFSVPLLCYGLYVTSMHQYACPGPGMAHYSYTRWCMHRSSFDASLHNTSLHPQGI